MHVGTRIYPLILPQRATLPAVTYDRVYDSPENGFTGYLSEHNPFMEISSWARTYSEAKEVKSHVHAAMNQATTFKAVLVGSNDTVETRENNTLVYRVRSEYSCWNKIGLS